jgi:hypothetical protein
MTCSMICHLPITHLPASPLWGVCGSTRRGMKIEPHTSLPTHTLPPNVAPSWASIVREGSSAHCLSANFMALHNSCVAKGFQARILIKNIAAMSSPVTAASVPVATQTTPTNQPITASFSTCKQTRKAPRRRCEVKLLRECEGETSLLLSPLSCESPQSSSLLPSPPSPSTLLTFLC